jgi:hypothetical protein
MLIINSALDSKTIDNGLDQECPLDHTPNAETKAVIESDDSIQFSSLGDLLDYLKN